MSHQLRFLTICVPTHIADNSTPCLVDVLEKVLNDTRELMETFSFSRRPQERNRNSSLRLCHYPQKKDQDNIVFTLFPPCDWDVTLSNSHFSNAGTLFRDLCVGSWLTMQYEEEGDDANISGVLLLIGQLTTTAAGRFNHCKHCNQVSLHLHLTRPNITY